MKRVDLKGDSPLSRLLKSVFQPSEMPPHERKFQRFKYTSPQLEEGKSRAIVRLATTDNVYAGIQKLSGGGEGELHLHAAMTGVWIVLSGKARFSGDDGVQFDVGPMEGVTVPRGTWYAFEQVGEKPLEILQVETLYPAKKNTYKSVAATESDQRIVFHLNQTDLFDARM